MSILVCEEDFIINTAIVAYPKFMLLMPVLWCWFKYALFRRQIIISCHSSHMMFTYNPSKCCRPIKLHSEKFHIASCSNTEYSPTWNECCTVILGLSMLSIPAPRPARLSGHIRADFQTRVIQLTLPALSMVVVGPDRKWCKMQLWKIQTSLCLLIYIYFHFISQFCTTSFS